MNRILLIAAATSSQTKEVSQAFLREYYMPLALLYLSGSLAPHFEVHILDLNTLELWDLAPEEAKKVIETELLKKIDQTQPFLVGINCLFSGQISQVVHLANIVKRYNPGINVATGGIHPTIFSEDLLAGCPSLDFVLQGEGEENTLQLALALQRGQSLRQIDGLTYRDKSDRIINQPKTAFIQDVDSIPRPAYHLFDFEKYAIDTSKWHNPKQQRIGVPIPLITSRSCPQRCNFCVMYRVMGPRFRSRSAGHVLDEMEFLYKEYNTRYFEILDDNFTLNKRRTLDICRGIIDRKMDIQFRTVNGLSVNSLDDESVDALAEAGLVWAPIAIESGSDHIRNQVMGKHLDLKKIFEVTKAFSRHPQIILTSFFIIGMPEDTPETLMETYNLMLELEVDDCSVANAVPFPGTALHAQCSRESLFVKEPGGWADESLFATNKGDGFFIKPKAMSIEELIMYRGMFDDLRLKKMSSKYKGISRTAWEAQKNDNSHKPL